MIVDMTCLYNMVGAAVAMVISTMHDSHNARKFEKKISHSNISIDSDEIA